jgi:hypothetical protein
MGHQSAISIPSLKEIGSAQRFAGDPPKDPGLHLWTHRFENIQGKRIPLGIVHVETESYARIKAQSS